MNEGGDGGAPQDRHLGADRWPARPAGLERLRVLGIAGSLRASSASCQVLEFVIRLIQNAGIHADVFDLRVRKLPFCSGDKDDPYTAFPDVHALRRAVADCHALILATPEYHGSVSGVLKNALDLLDFEHLEGKVVAGICTLGGPQNSNSLNDLRRIVRWCHAWMIPEQVAVGWARQALSGGRLNDEGLTARLSELANRLVLSTLQLNDYFAGPAVLGRDAKALHPAVAQISLLQRHPA